MGIPEQGGDIVLGCSDLRQKRSVAVPYQYVGPLLVAYPLDKVESLLRMGWQVWSQYCCLAVEIFFQGDGRGARSRCKEAVQEKNLTYHTYIQQPLPSILQAAPSSIGRGRSPASSGFRVTVPSSSTKHGMPTAPTLFASSNAGSRSRSLRKAFRSLTCRPISMTSYMSLPFTCCSTYVQSGQVSIPYIFIIGVDIH